MISFRFPQRSGKPFGWVKLWDRLKKRIMSCDLLELSLEVIYQEKNIYAKYMHIYLNSVLWVGHKYIGMGHQFSHQTEVEPPGQCRGFSPKSAEFPTGKKESTLDFCCCCCLKWQSISTETTKQQQFSLLPIPFKCSAEWVPLFHTAHFS